MHCRPTPTGTDTPERTADEYSRTLRERATKEGRVGSRDDGIARASLTRVRSAVPMSGPCSNNLCFSETVVIGGVSVFSCTFILSGKGTQSSAARLNGEASLFSRFC